MSLFPPSYFSEEILNKCADRFKVPQRYYTANLCPQKRSAVILTDDERRYIQQELTNQQMSEVYVLYYKLEVFDMDFLIPRIPIAVVMDICKLNRSMASSLKRVCNTLRDMDIDEYNRRVATRIADQIRNSPDPVNVAPAPKQDTSKWNMMMSKMRPYLNAKKFLKMPPEIGAYVHEVPEYMVKRAWTGPQFTTQYKKAKALYKAVKS